MCGGKGVVRSYRCRKFVVSRDTFVRNLLFIKSRSIDMTSDSLTRGVKASLKAQYYTMNDSWLNECIEYYISEHDNPSRGEVLAFVVSQWQLSDLREINNENGCLPGCLARERCTELSGKYILQMDKMYDIASSKYSQLERIRNISNDNLKTTESDEGRNWEPRRKRMIQFHLTDGVQDVTAIECEPIRFLKDILPGYKLMIVGPIACRRGILMLKENNVLEIGGEVESLLIRNAMENVLARALHLEENPDPYNDNNEENNDDKNGFFEDEFEINLEELTQIERSSQENNRANDSRSDGIVDRNGCPLVAKRKYDASRNDTSSCIQGSMPKRRCKDDDDDDDDDLTVLTDDLSSDRNSGISRSNASCFRSVNDSRSTPLRVLPKERGKVSNRSDDSIAVIAQERTVAPGGKLEKTPIDTEERSRSAVSVELPVTFGDDFEFDNIEVIPKTGVRRIDDNLAKRDDGKQSAATEEPKGDFTSNGSSERETRRHQVPCNSVSTMNNNVGSREGVVRDIVDDASESKAGSVGEIAKSAELTSRNNNYSKEAVTTTLTFSGKRSAGMMSPPVASPPKVRCIRDAPRCSRTDRKITEYVDASSVTREGVPPKICDFICDVVKGLAAVADDAVVYRTIRGRIATLNKLSKRDSSWHLAATITDDTASIDVVFSSEVLERLLGFSVKEFSRKKKTFKTNPRVEDELRKGFRTAENKLKRMDALMEVELLPDKSVKVVGVTELTNEQKVIIEKRMKLLKL